MSYNGCIGVYKHVLLVWCVKRGGLYGVLKMKLGEISMHMHMGRVDFLYFKKAKCACTRPRSAHFILDSNACIHILACRVNKLTLVNEYVHGVQHLKLCNWEHRKIFFITSLSHLYSFFGVYILFLAYIFFFVLFLFFILFCFSI